MTKTSNGRHRERQDPHWIEWVTGIVSALLVTAMVGWLGWEAATRPMTPPDLSIAILTKEKTAGGYRVVFDIANAGTTTAAAVTVLGRLVQNGQVLEENPVVIDYVAAESTARAALLFQNDPAGSTLEIRPTGYASP